MGTISKWHFVTWNLVGQFLSYRVHRHTDRQKDGQTHRHTDGQEYSIVLVDKPKI